MCKQHSSTVTVLVHIRPHTMMHNGRASKFQLEGYNPDNLVDSSPPVRSGGKDPVGCLEYKVPPEAEAVLETLFTATDCRSDQNSPPDS